MFPGDTPYVGGAGAAFLTGYPVKVDLAFTSKGRFGSDVKPRPTVDGIALAKEKYAERQYTVAATVTTTDEEANPADITLALVLRDAQGKVVGADYGTADKAPPSLRAGSKIRVEVPFVEVSGVPTTAELTAVNPA